MKLQFASLIAVAVLFAASEQSQAAGAELDALTRYESGADVMPLRAYEELVRKAVADPALRPIVEADFARVLTSDSTFEARRFACQQLAVIGTQVSVPALAGLLKSDEFVGMACLALAQNPSTAASDVLRTALGTTTGRSQAQVAHALGVRGDVQAVAALEQLTVADDVVVAEAAIIALGKIGTPATWGTLANLRKQPPAALSRAVAESSFLLAETLVTQGNQEAAQAIYLEYLAPANPADLRRGALSALLRLDRDGGVERMSQVLAGSDAALKPVAIAALSDVKSADASAKFAALLPKLEASEQALMVQALARRGDPAALTAVQSQLASADKAVRLTAITALGESGDASTVTVLARALMGAKDAEELKAIELALSGLKGGDEVDKALAAQLRNRMAGPKAPFLAALVRRANPWSAPILAAEAASSDPAMAKLAFQGLSRVAGPDDLPMAIKAIGDLRAEAARDEAEASIGQVLNRSGDPAKGSAVVREALSSAKSVEARGSLIRLLATCPDALGLDAVKAALGDSNAAVKDAARRTLAGWPDASAWDALKALYGQAGSESERVLALRGLVRLLGEQNAHPDAQLVGRYQELLVGAKGDNDRKLILGALAGCPHPEALKLAVGQLANAGVRAEVKLAVEKIAEAIKGHHPEAATEALKQIR